MTRDEIFQRAIECAKEAAGLVQDDYEQRTLAFATIAEALTDRGEIGAAYQILEQGTSPMWPYHESPDFADRLVKSVENIAKQGNLVDARCAAAEIPDIDYRINAWTEIARISHATHDIEVLRSIAMQADRVLGTEILAYIAEITGAEADFIAAQHALEELPRRLKSTCSIYICVAYATHGHFDQAEKIAKSVKKGFKHDIKVEVARQRAQHHDFAGARAAAYTMSDMEQRYLMLAYIAKVMTEQNLLEEAEKIIAEIKDTEIQETLLANLILVYIKNKNLDTSYRLLLSLENPKIRFEVLRHIFSISHKSEDLEAAVYEMWMIQEPERGRSLISITTELTALGNTHRAYSLIQEYPVPKYMTDYLDPRSEALGKMAIILAHTEGLSAAETAVAEIPESYWLHDALFGISAILARQQNFDEARKVAARIGHTGMRASAYAFIGSLSASEEDRELAFETAAKVESPRWRTGTFVEVGKFLTNTK